MPKFFGTECRGDFSAYALYKGKKIDPEAAPCVECDDTMPLDKIKDHLVSEHGYIREAGQVFKRHECHCGKPGLYRVGNRNFCRDHKNIAQKMRGDYTRICDLEKGARDRDVDRVDKILKSQHHFKKVKQPR